MRNVVKVVGFCGLVGVCIGTHTVPFKISFKRWDVSTGGFSHGF